MRAMSYPAAPNHSQTTPYAAQAPAPYQPPSRGVAAWLQFLWVYLPIPGLNLIAWLIGAIVTWNSGRAKNPIAAGNGRAALNWCLTYLLVVGVFLAIAIITLPVASSSGRSIRDGDPATFPAIGWGIAVVVMGIAGLVNSITGAMRASRGEVFRGYLTVPFLRESKAAPHAQFPGAAMR